MSFVKIYSEDDLYFKEFWNVDPDKGGLNGYAYKYESILQMNILLWSGFRDTWEISKHTGMHIYEYGCESKPDTGPTEIGSAIASLLVRQNQLDFRIRRLEEWVTNGKVSKMDNGGGE